VVPLVPSASTTFDSTVEILVEMLGSTAPDAAARNPASSAYSIKSWPWVSFQIFNFQVAFSSAVMRFSPRLDIILPAGLDRSKVRMYRFGAPMGLGGKQY